MRPKRLITGVLGGMLLLPVGCAPRANPPAQHDEQPTRVEPRPVPGAPADQGHPQRTSQPGSVLPASVPIVYYLRFDHPPLTAAQVERVVARAAPSCPEGQNLWFIYVTANWEREGQLQARAKVYFTPEGQTPRLRKGRYVLIDEIWADLMARLVESLPFAERPRDTPRADVDEYWQVSLQEEPFGEDLAVPSGTLLPFEKPADFAEEQIIRLVDLVRTNPCQPQQANKIRSASRFDGRAPIVWISRRGDVVDIHTGAMQGPVAGHGQLLECKIRDDGSFEVVGIGFWNS